MVMRSSGWLIAVLTIGSLLPNLQRPLGAQTREDGFTVRYICFTARPKLTNPYDNSELPPVFQKLYDGGLPDELGANPSAFLDRLRKDEPHFDFSVAAAGTAARDGNGLQHSIAVGKREQGPYGVIVRDNASVIPTSSTKATLRQNGAVNFRRPEGNGTLGWHWNNSVKPDTVLGRTYSHGAITLPDGTRVVLVFCVLRGKV